MVSLVDVWSILCAIHLAHLLHCDVKVSICAILGNQLVAGCILDRKESIAQLVKDTPSSYLKI